MLDRFEHRYRHDLALKRGLAEPPWHAVDADR